MSEEQTHNKQESSTSDESGPEEQSEKKGDLNLNDHIPTPEELLKSLLNKKKLKNGILTLIGTLILKLGISAPIIIMNLSTYLMSYLRSFEPEGKKTLTFGHTYFIQPIAVVSALIISPFVGIIEKKLGLKKTISLGIIFGVLATVILIISHNYFLDLFAFVLFSFTLPFSGVVSGKNLSMYFFSKRGTINGILSLLSSLCNAGFNFIGEFVIINPGKEDVKKEDDGFYDPELSKRVVNLFYFILILMLTSYFISLFLIIPYDIKTFGDPWEEFKKNGKGSEKENEKNDIDDLLLPEEEEISEVIINSSNAEELENIQNKKNDTTKTKEKIKSENEKENKDENENENKDENNENDAKKAEEKKKHRLQEIKKVLKTFRLWRLFLIAAFKMPATNLLMSTWRPIALTKNIKTELLQKIGTFSFISISVAMPLFGFLADKVQYRILICILNTCVTIASFIFFYSYEHENLFFFLIMLMRFIMGGEIQVGNPHFMKVFGLEYFIEIAGIIGLSTLFLSPLCSFLAFYIGKMEEKRDLALKIMYMTGGGLSFVSVILAAFETEEPFNYES